MKKWVSTTEKRSFLKWFLENHQLKRSDARKLIEYLINKPYILDNITFTEELKANEKTIVISSFNSDEPGFEYYCNQRKTDNVAQALGDLMNSPSDKIKLILHFYGKSLNHRYLQIVETPIVDKIKQYEQYQKDAKEAEQLIDKLLLQNEIKRMKKEIDLALDARDEVLFKNLVSKLKELEQSEL